MSNCKGEHMKIILSRKGFDSGAGGYASPFFIKEGRLLSLPIPEENKIYSTSTGRLYSDLQFDDSTTYLDIMNQLGIKNYTGKNAHLDPDISPNVLIDRKPGWKGLFGQCDAAQRHLFNNSVQPGDLFLFFGWFRDVIKINDKYKYIPYTDKHIIWGYMQVGEIDSIGETKEYESWKLDHPHYRNRKRKFNTGYIARENLDFNPDLPGCGVFSFDDSLVLTYPNQKNRSIWKLPQFFHPSYGTQITYHGNQQLWELHDDYCILHSVFKGQEFIMTGNDSVIEWAKDLIRIDKKPQIKSHQIKTNVLLTKSVPVIHAQKSAVADNDEKRVSIDKPDDCHGALREVDKRYNSEANNIVSMACYRRATNEEFVVKFNLEDMDKVKQFDVWKVEKGSKKVYANRGNLNTYLHRLILGECEGKKVFAKDGNYFNCTRDNLYVKP